MNNDFQAPPPTYAEVHNNFPSYNGVQGYNPPGGPHNDPRYAAMDPTTPVVYAVKAVPMGVFGKHSVQCTCSHCGALIATRVEESNGLLAWLLCVLLLVFGCWLGCCLIPLCISDFKNINHYCPNCKSFLGEYRPL